MRHLDPINAANATDASAGQTGWTVTGTKPGPTLVIIGKGPAFRAAIARLQDLPSLAYLRGQLMVCAEVPDVSIDVLISIKTEAEAEAYWHILGAAARLGMIAGRGIPARYLSAGIASVAA